MASFGARNDSAICVFGNYRFSLFVRCANLLINENNHKIHAINNCLLCVCFFDIFFVWFRFIWCSATDLTTVKVLSPRWFNCASSCMGAPYRQTKAVIFCLHCERKRALSCLGLVVARRLISRYICERTILNESQRKEGRCNWMSSTFVNTAHYITLAMKLLVMRCVYMTWHV